jgi:mono/diheme cytochrome c family protein
MRKPFRARERATVRALASLAALAISATAGPALAQMVNSADTARKGHQLATVACANCHRVAVDQHAAPLVVPPAPSFEAIAQWPGINSDVLEHFITTTRRSADHPTGMPNPYLLEYQVREVVTYILSLRK